MLPQAVSSHRREIASSSAHCDRVNFRHRQLNVCVLFRHPLVPRDDRSFLIGSRLIDGGAEVKVSITSSTLDGFAAEQRDGGILQLLDGCDARIVSPPFGVPAVGFFCPRNYTLHYEWQKLAFEM